MNSSLKSVLIIFMKYPVKGRVKTRLAKSIGDEKTLEIYRTLVEATIKAVRDSPAVPYEIIIYLDESQYISETSMWLEIPRENFYVQNGKDLGEKMLNAFIEQFGRYEKAVIIGTDIPGLSSEVINRSLAGLDKADVVAGPAVDGGYYLLGLKKVYPGLFRGINWSTDAVLNQTLAVIKHLNLSVSLLEKRRDIDTVEDLEVENFSSYSGI